MSNEKMYNVKNRSAGMVVYRVPELNVRRVFQPGEVKRISYAELEALSFRAGGRELMEDYLQIKDAEVLESMNIHAEAEYYMDKEHVEYLLKSATMDEFLDALDFAPEGVLDMIKDMSVSLKLGDYNKRQALKDKFGFDVESAIKNMDATEEVETVAPAQTARRAAPIVEIPTAAPAVPAQKYNIIEE